MRLILLRDGNDGAEANALRYALSTAPLAGLVLTGTGRFWCTLEEGRGLSTLAGRAAPEDLVWIASESWRGRWPANEGHRVAYAEATGLSEPKLAEAAKHPWLVISDGRFATHLSSEPLERVFEQTDADVVAITANPRLRAYREHVRVTGQGKLVGCRRLFRDSAEPAPVPTDWPHHLFIRTQCLDRALADGLPTEFHTLLDRFRSCGMTVQAAAVAGSVADMGSQEGLMAFCRTVLTRLSPLEGFSPLDCGRQTFLQGSGAQVSPRARFLGPVLLGAGVCVESDAVIIGPSILCDNSTVRQGAVVNASILGAAVTVDSDRILRDTLVMSEQAEAGMTPHSFARTGHETVCLPRQSAFRTWPRFSYPRCWKRVIDVVASSIILILFAPLIPFIALAIKLNSPGPIFFKDKRQGLHGKPFHCIKFRTMRVGAAEIQDKLRFVCEVDGPQFKMADDPRISTVGRFLRETYLDEIPQFFNVLIGQMSMVGPRPSPESENTRCPWWRDARLSVRPGISGLWQIFRTREPYRDFQEWIYYDTWYVRALSVRMDLWVCWRTFKKMVDNFIRQF